MRDELRACPGIRTTTPLPWQSGGTGVGYNSESTGRALTKIADLFDPAFAGKVTLLTTPATRSADPHAPAGAGPGLGDTPPRR